MPIAPGTRLGPYVVQESIGQGAMGVVYRAYHAQLERTGAVKVLQALSPDEETTARFRREAQAIAHMRHPNVLNVFDFGEFEGVPYMIVEFVEGGSLSGRLKHAELTPAQALKYLRGIGSALDYAHSLGIVHRDVKPANVLLGTADTPILADFGLAKLLQSSSIKSITGVTTGTPAYMAPEQVTGSEVGPAADRYSLAVMAYEMLAGSLPFDDAGVLEVLYAHVHREPPHPSLRNTTLTNRVDAIILRGLDKNPSSRWETCDAFVSALERALLRAAPEAERTLAYPMSTPATSSTVHSAPPLPKALNGAARAAAPATVAVAVAEKVNPATATVFAPLAPAAEEERKRKRRRGLVWIGAAALVLLLLLSITAAFIVGMAPSVDVKPQIVARGQLVRVTATNVPANQVGELQLHSVIHTFAFTANNVGKVDEQIEIPFDVELGDHRIELCWNSACRASTQLRVVAGGVAETSPGASPNPSTSPSSTPGRTPTPSPSTAPGKTPSPKPTSNPTHNPSPTPSHNPTPSPSPRPTPSPSPTPRPSPSPSPSPTCPFSGPSITESPNPVTGGNNATINGSNFKPGSVTVQYYAGSTLTSTKTVTANANCAFSTTVTTKNAGLLGSRTDKVVVCDSLNRCASVTFKTQNLL